MRLSADAFVFRSSDRRIGSEPIADTTVRFTRTEP
jgi:hypothetical protein